MPADRHGPTGLALLGMSELPVQGVIFDVLDAVDDDGLPEHPLVAVQVPRRAGKTTSLLALAVGRCAARPDYAVAYTAQTGLKSRERFREVLLRLDRYGGGGWLARRQNGAERIEWENGSVLAFGPPIPGFFRGDALDLAVLDEGQEHDEESSADVLGALLPTLDTRPEAQLVVAGTAGAERSGLLWTALSHGRDGDWGVVDYAAPDDADPDDEATWRLAHPGIGPGGLTRIAAMRRNHQMMSAETFSREYLGIWPATATRSAFTAELWEAAGREHAPRPVRFGLAYDVAPDSSRATIAAAWRLPDRTARVEVLDSRPGTAWVVPALLRLVRQQRGMVIGYDSAGGGGLHLADQLKAAPVRPDTQGLTTAAYVSACAAFAAAVVDGQLEHARQASLTTAVDVAQRRRIGDAGWGWGRRLSTGDITPLVAATVALKVFDDMPGARSLKVLTAS